MKRFGSDFKQLTSVGTMAALSAIFTAPLFGFAAPLYGGEPEGSEQTITLPKTSKLVVYFCAIAGALGALMGLSSLFGGVCRFRITATSTSAQPKRSGFCRLP